MYALLLGLLLASPCLPCGGSAALVYTPHPHRSMSQRHAFMAASGFPHGRKGWVVDHVVPLCAGGRDAPANMQWQTNADSKVKDRQEDSLCLCLKYAAKATAALSGNR